MTAEEIAIALGGRRYGRAWKCRCPAHDDKTPSLSIKDSATGRVLVRCHAGCEQMAVIDQLRDMGLWGSTERPPQLQVVNKEFDNDEARRQYAMKIWHASVPAPGTPVEAYLRNRGITLPIPTSLRFHNNLRHHPSGTEWPAMVALIVDVEGKPLGVHRTYLGVGDKRDDKGKAPISPPRLSLGSCRFGAVRLSDLQEGKALVVAEGIETALSVAQACDLPAWSALSADGVKHVKLPAAAKSVILAADHDANGTGMAAAKTAQARLLREGRTARIVMPPDVGTDFNDVLLKRKESSHV